MEQTTFERKLTSQVPLPMCVVDKQGKIVGSNSRIGEVFIYEEIAGYDFFALTGITIDDLIAAAEKQIFKTLERNDRKFRLFASLDEETDGSNIFVFFYDITRYTMLKSSFNEQKICMAKIYIDNYDELLASTPPDMRLTISSLVDRTIREWAQSAGAPIVNHSRNRYTMTFTQARLSEMVEEKFSILDVVRQIETEADFPMSLSIGVGSGGETLLDTEEMANQALELAMGRGGDQAVVRDPEKTNYYGGKLQTVEKANKGKSRVVAHTLRQFIGEADKIYIMGHKNPDMDALGAALGMVRVCRMNGKEASIVISKVGDSLQALYKQVKNTGKYSFVDHETALAGADGNTLLIIVDTHRPSYLECKQLLNKATRIAIIDHHRKAADSVEGADLNYIESYASSASELVAEIIQYAGPKRVLEKLEAEALMAGMSLDTNRFAVKTGVRTFEAAAWLRRSGADTAEVKRFFQTDLESFQVRAKCIASAEVLDTGIAVSICDGENPDAQVINSQVADELLNVRGVKASFVAGRNDRGRTGISARSLGEINVQVLMEQLGGGGHLTTAGAQVDMSPEEVIERVKEMVQELTDSEAK